MVDIERERAKLRQAAILQALYITYPRPMGGGLLREHLTPDLDGSAEKIDRALYYLADKQQVRFIDQSGPGRHVPIVALTADGVDAVESADGFDTSRRRLQRMLRLRVLQALDWSRPAPAGYRLIATALASDSDLDLSPPSLQRALAYLTERGLAALDGESGRILSAGIDYLGGDGDGIAGVARPADW